MPKHQRTSNPPTLPIKVKRHRQHPTTITSKRYRSYSEESTKWSDRLKYLHSQWIATEKKKGILQQAATHLNVPRKTLSNHWNEWKDSILREGFTERLTAEIDNDNRSHDKRVFNEFEERQLYDILVREMDYNERGLTDSDVADIALAYWKQLHPAALELDEQFSASHGWVTDFKRRWALASGARWILNAKLPPDPLLVERYRQTMMEWAKLVFPHCFLNLDETKWYYANPPRLVFTGRVIVTLLVLEPIPLME